MKCIEAEQLSELLLGGKIDFSKKGGIKNHLQTCRSCRQDFEQLQAVSNLLKKSLPASASPALDKRVLESFENHYADRVSAKTAFVERGFFKHFMMPIPALAAIIALFAIGIFAAYQFGKLSADKSNLNTAEMKSSNLPANKYSQNNETAQMPAVKYVKVPVVREKQITRIIYKDTNIKKTLSPINPKIAETAANKKNQYLTEFDLKGFQTVSELKPVIIKEGKNQ